MNRTILANVIACFFILLFAYTGIDKLLDFGSFKDQLTMSPLLGSFAGLIAWAVPVTELLLALILFIPGWRLKGLYASLVLMVLFTIYIITLIFINDELSCNCGGIIQNLSPPQHILFNLACILLAGVAIYNTRNREISTRFRLLTTTGTLILFCSIGWIMLIAARPPAKITTGLEGAPLPSFSMLLPDSLTHLNTADIPAGKQFVVVVFSPYCAHCQAAIKDIIRHIGRFDSTMIYFVTPYPFFDMRKFYRAFHVKKYPTIVIGSDPQNTLLRYFKSYTIPYITIYDARKKLKEVLPSQTNASFLAGALQNE
jgi:thiol-disulfide isomerase/thioredoxin